MNTLALLHPFAITASVLINWLLTFLIVALVVAFVVWIVSMFAGPPNIPEPFRWIIWVIVAVVLLIFVLAALGVAT